VFIPGMRMMKCRWLLVSGLVLLLIESRAGYVAEVSPPSPARTYFD